VLVLFDANSPQEISLPVRGVGLRRLPPTLNCEIHQSSDERLHSGFVVEPESYPLAISQVAVSKPNWRIAVEPFSKQKPAWVCRAINLARNPATTTTTTTAAAAAAGVNGAAATAIITAHTATAADIGGAARLSTATHATATHATATHATALLSAATGALGTAAGEVELRHLADA
jgi:hypothetical protein